MRNHARKNTPLPIKMDVAVRAKVEDAAKKLPVEGFKRPWPPRIKMDEAVKAKVEKLLGS